MANHYHGGGAGALTSQDARQHHPNPIVRTSALRQNPRGWWTVYYSVPSGGNGSRSQRFSLRTTNRAEAETRFADWLRDAQAQPDGSPKATAPATIEQIVNHYLDQAFHGREHSTQKSVIRAIVRTLGNLTPKDIGQATVRDYCTLRRRDGVGDSSIRRELGALMAALKFSRRGGLWQGEMPDFDRPKGGKARVTWMEFDQEQHFWEVAQQHPDKRLGLFVALALDTAARRGAIMDLTWDRVDLAKRAIDFQVPGAVQTRKRRPAVPICDRLLPVLVAAARHAPRDAQDRPTGRLIGFRVARSINPEFARLAKRAGLPWVTPHVCRHTWASLAIQRGAPVFHVARMLGDSERMVETVYAKLRLADLMTVANMKNQGAGLASQQGGHSTSGPNYTNTAARPGQAPGQGVSP